MSDEAGRLARARAEAEAADTWPEYLHLSELADAISRQTLCQTCGRHFKPARRGECSVCGSDAGVSKPLPPAPATEPREQ